MKAYNVYYKTGAAPLEVLAKNWETAKKAAREVLGVKALPPGTAIYEKGSASDLAARA